ncbi:MAG: hypothetical protein ACKVP0_19160 [Pirellulaceae bacterium]
MATILNWRVSSSASALHAAAALVRGEALVDAGLVSVLFEPAAALQAEIQSAQLPEDRFWRNLLGVSATIESNRELARLALVKTIGRGTATENVGPRIAAAVTAVEGVFARHLPKLADELPLRMGPLREQWEARGPGFLWQIGTLTEESLLVEEAEVVVIHPALGGDGAAWLNGNQVRVEGVLANPFQHLPEVVRLGWLISQLNLDLPALSENVQADRLPRVAQLAMLPVALAAGREVELCLDTPDLLSQAITNWRLAADPTVVTQWWETYRDSRPPFAVALAALDKMLD